ncbi:hypothetical protein TTHN1_01595 [Thermus thermophilus]|uniref:Uncharacterized protein n=1 Tax=Thermus thermophilus TaxID=274 RepID=A0A3P4ATC7_THETH|nr:hypothetical protein [Thermus thermophilus]VCU53809.1 hypothetical protein TTHN1_01595 [Thermus thermophilus]
MLNLLGVKPEDVQNLVRQGQAALDELRAEMACVKESLQAIERILGYEYGRPARGLMGHDPYRLPLIAQVDAGAQPTRVDLAGLLGKLATRGHVVNIGDAKVRIWFVSGAQRVGPYILLPSAAVELSFALEALEVADAGEGPSRVQLLMQ